MLQVVYLHGLASSPQSGKARFFDAHLRAAGAGMHCPDLNEPDFATLTVSRMIGQVERLIAGLPPGPLAAIGSSLGGLVALHLAARQTGAPDRPIDRVVLLAPALDFGRRRSRIWTDEDVVRWRQTGWLDMFHHGYGEPRRVGFALYEDAGRYDSFGIECPVPTLIYQGRRDEVVDPQMVEDFAAGRANVTMRLVDDDHQLLAHADEIWKGSAAFLGLAGE